MRRFTYYLPLLLFVPALAFMQKNEDDLVDWKPGRPLVWEDYLGSPDPASDAAALTATFLGIEYEINEKGFSWKIQCRFSRPRSWVRSKTAYILQHEQGHFDIAEIFARKLNKKMREYKFDRNTYQKELRTIYEGITTEKENFQNQYDKETDHSRKKEQQLQWTEKIRKMLDDLEPYSDYH